MFLFAIYILIFIYYFHINSSAKSSIKCWKLKDYTHIIILIIICILKAYLKYYYFWYLLHNLLS